MALKFLLLGASHSDFYAALAIKQFGHILYTSGSYVSGLSNVISDNYYNVDYKNFEACLELCNALEPDIVIPSANDFSYLTVARIVDNDNSLSNIDCYQTALTLHIKDLFRLFCKHHNLPSPKLYGILNDQEFTDYGLQYPCVVKPVDLSGGKGVKIIANYTQLLSYFESVDLSSNHNRFVVEEYIPGQLYSMSGFINEGIASIIHYDKEYLTADSFSVKSSFTGLTNDELQSLRSLEPSLQFISDHLNLVDGLFHVQVILDHKFNTPYIVEITRRMPGDLYSIPVEAISSFNHAMNSLSAWSSMSEFTSYSIFSELKFFNSFSFPFANVRRSQAYNNEYEASMLLNSADDNIVAPFLQNNRFGLKYENDIDHKGVVFEFEPF